MSRPFSRRLASENLLPAHLRKTRGDDADGREKDVVLTLDAHYYWGGAVVSFQPLEVEPVCNSETARRQAPQPSQRKENKPKDEKTREKRQNPNNHHRLFTDCPLLAQKG